MRTSLSPLAIVAAGCVIAAPLAANPDFKSPVRLKAGGKFLGEGRYYPSPVFRDMNDDGKLDIVVGDLRGDITFALREGSAMKFAAENDLLGDDGKAIDFTNW